MPELPEVETTCRGIAKALVGYKITRVHIREGRLRWPVNHQALKRLKNQKILSVSRRAKYILIEFAPGFLVLHLGMSGSLRLVKPNESCRKHDHIEWQISSGLVLRYHDPRRFGAVLWAENLEALPQLQKLGPEPLSSAFNAQYLFAKAQKSQVVIKSFIMNQQIVVGVGNIYAVESLYLAKIHPLRISSSLSLAECRLLCVTIKRVLKKAIEAGGTTLQDFYQSDGQPGYFAQKLQVYDEAGKPCRKCKTVIEKITVQNRSTYFCSTCQPFFA